MKLGIDIGGSHIETGVILENGKLIGKETRDIIFSEIDDEKRVEEIILETIKLEIQTLLERYNYGIEDISQIGLAVPGSSTKTSIKNMVNLHITNFNIAERLNKIYNTKITLRNDGKCAGLAEKKYGALKKYDDCIFLCIGTGVGTAVFYDGDLLVPKNNPGFEFGHMIIKKGGKKCNCGNNGCFETYASMKRFKEDVIKKFELPKNSESEEVQNFIRKNITKSDVKKFVDEYLDNVAVGISNIINIFEPQAICFGGSFSYYDDIFLDLLNEKVKQHVFNKDSNFILLSAKLKNDAGIIGAVL